MEDYTCLLPTEKTMSYRTLNGKQCCGEELLIGGQGDLILGSKLKMILTILMMF